MSQDCRLCTAIYKLPENANNRNSFIKNKCFVLEYSNPQCFIDLDYLLVQFCSRCISTKKMCQIIAEELCSAIMKSAIQLSLKI